MILFFDRFIYFLGYWRREGGCCLGMSDFCVFGFDSYVCDFFILWDKFFSNWVVFVILFVLFEVIVCFFIVYFWCFLLIFRILLYLYFYVDVCVCKWFYVCGVGFFYV